MTVPRRLGDIVGGNGPTGAGAVVHDDRLAERVAKLLRHESCDHVTQRTRWTANNYLEGPWGKRLRPHRQVGGNSESGG
ncbi:hypothetical protein D3C71_1884860 [compost metagenome]